MHPNRHLFHGRALPLLAAPLVFAAQALLAFGVFRLGCTPALEDVDFFGVPVTAFLLAALTAAALVLIVFAGLQLPRSLGRAAAAGGQAPARRTVAIVLGLALVVASFVLAGAWGVALLETPCP